MRPDDLGTILSIWAHPDDETYLAGGVMAAAAAAGQRVVCASATAGELGTDDPVAWPPERLGRRRAWEAAAAMAVLGVREHLIFGWPDGGLADRSCRDGANAVAGLLEDVRPDTILTFGPDGQTFHPDHLAVHRWVRAAWEQRGRRERLLLSTTTDAHVAEFRERYERWGVYMAEDRPVPTPEDELALRFVADGAALDQKLAALAAMATQTSAIRARLGEAAYAAMIAEEAFALPR